MREVKIFLGADHAGFALKEKIKKHLEKNYNITDLGTNVIIIDDIIGTGHTILETIKIAKSHKANKITVIGVHAVLTNQTNIKKITKQAKLITTNTIPNPYAKIDVSPIIVQALKRFNK